MAENVGVEANEPETNQEAPAVVAPEVNTEEVVATSMAAPRDTTGLKKMLRIFAELVLLAAVVYLAMWGYGLQSKNKDLQKQINVLNSNPAVVEQQKTTDLVNKVGALTQLPTNEAPQAALVSDASTFKQQYPMLSEVQNGDQILLYVKSGKLIVYRPSTNKIVQIAPVSISNTTK